MRATTVFSTILAVLPFALAQNPHAARGHSNHQGLAKRASGAVQLHKRFSAAKFSYYDVEVGLGACGKQNHKYEHTVALNSAQYGGGYPGPHCFEQITISYNGKTTTATIMDECPGCPYGGLDLTEGLFSFFDSTDKGIIYGSWSFGAGGDAPAETPTPTTTTTKTPEWTPEPTPTYTPTPKPTTTTTWTPEPEPTTTSSKWVEPTPEWTPEPSSSSIPTSSKVHSSTYSAPAPSSSSSAPASSSSVHLESGVASGLAVTASPVPSTTPGSVNNVLVMNEVFIGLGGLAAAAAQAQ